MSESSKNASKNLKFPPPKSLMNLDDAEEIWTIITKRYPKAAPLLCEMESVLDHAENLLEQLKTPCDLGIVLSTEKSLDINLSESDKTISETVNSCQNSIFKNVESNMTDVLETQEYSFDYSTTTESIVEQNNEISFNSSINNFTQTINSFVENNESSKFNLTNTTELINSPRCQSTSNEVTENFKKSISILKESPRKIKNQEESIPHFKKVVETIKMNEESIQKVKKIENLKNDIKPQQKLENLTDTIRIKITDTASIDAWDKVVYNSEKSNEISPRTNTLELTNRTYDEKMSPDRFSNKRDIFTKSTKIPQSIEVNSKIYSKEEDLQKDKKQKKSQECGDISILSTQESPVIILDQYSEACNKPVDYITNDDRKGKIKITCTFAGYNVSSCGTKLNVVKNEAAARMLHMLVTSQMEENIADLQKFSKQQILKVMKLDKGGSFIPISAKRMTMVKLYTICLEQNFHEPQYEVIPDKQHGFLSTCKVLDYVGKGTGLSDGNAKEKAAEDLYKRYYQKIKNELKDH